MEYQKYIDLGFKRVEMNDNVEFKQTGYTGFILSKKISERISIEVCSGELDRPKMYLKKKDSDCCLVMPIKPEFLEELF
jgi:hypothetical protein